MTKYKALIVKRQYQTVEFESKENLTNAARADIAAKLWNEAKQASESSADFYVEWVQVIDK